MVMQTILNNANRNDNFKVTHQEFWTSPWKKSLQGFIMTYNVNSFRELNSKQHLEDYHQQKIYLPVFVLLCIFMHLTKRFFFSAEIYF